jgi:two-component system sensor histidine kinase MprB
MSTMSFRRRMVLLAAGAVAAAVVIASVVVYIVTRNELSGQLDASLRAKVTPGRQFVKIETHLGPRELVRLTREGKLPALALAAVPPGFGLLAKSGGNAVRVLPSGSVRETAPAPAAGAITVQEGGPGEPGGSAHAGGFSQAEGSAAASGFAQTGGPVRASGAHVHPTTSGREGAAGVSQEDFAFARRAMHPTKGIANLAVGQQLRLVLQGPAVEGSAGYAQLSLANGEPLGSTSHNSLLPITAATRAVASGRRDAFFSDVNVHGTAVRVLTARAAGGAAWQVALPLADLHNTLDRLRLVLALVVLGGIALAAALGLVVSRAALVPVRRLTGAAERVARTQDLGHRIALGGQDELGRLSASFNTMLAALERSRLAQRQLVSDASHELRTPLTSIQANLDALALGEQLPAEKRERVLGAAQAQLRELTVLVGDLVDLSKNEVEEIEIEDVRLDLAAAAAIERARLHAPQCRFELDAEPCLVRAAPARLDRAIANLLDNAVKWTPASEQAGDLDGEYVHPSGPATQPSGLAVRPTGLATQPTGPAVRPIGPAAQPSGPATQPSGLATQPIEVRVRGGTLQVRDHGPGIAEEDLPRVFDRFYRAPAARGRDGAGLGLAIVRQTAEAHRGTVHASNDPGGGACLTLELPPLEMTPAELAEPREPLAAATTGPADG